MSKKHCSVRVSLRLNSHRGDYMGSDTTAHSARDMLLNINKCHNLPVVQQPWRSPEEEMGCQHNGFSREPPALQQSSVIQKKRPGTVVPSGHAHEADSAAVSPAATSPPGALGASQQSADSTQQPQKENAWFWLALIPESPADWLLPCSQAALLKGSPHTGKVWAMGSLPRGGHLSDHRGTGACTVLLTGFMCDTKGTVMGLGYLSKLTDCCLAHGDWPLSSELFYNWASNIRRKFKTRITALRCTLRYGQGGLRSMWTFLYMSHIQ